MMTRQMARCLTFIREFAAAHDGMSPSFDEIAERLGLHSKSGVHRIVDQLVERGLVHRLPNHARGLRAVEDAEKAFVDEETFALLIRYTAHRPVLISEIVSLAVREYVDRHPLETAP